MKPVCTAKPPCKQHNLSCCLAALVADHRTLVSTTLTTDRSIEPGAPGRNDGGGRGDSTGRGETLEDCEETETASEYYCIVSCLVLLAFPCPLSPRPLPHHNHHHRSVRPATAQSAYLRSFSYSSAKQKSASNTPSLLWCIIPISHPVM